VSAGAEPTPPLAPRWARTSHGARRPKASRRKPAGRWTEAARAGAPRTPQAAGHTEAAPRTLRVAAARRVGLRRATLQTVHSGFGLTVGFQVSADFGFGREFSPE